jgi:hypothetical protein
MRMVVNRWMEIIQKKTDEFLMPILSKLAVILHKKATDNIRRGPFSFTNDLKGDSHPFVLFPKFKMYDPKTIKIIPIRPEKSGYSPTMIGEVRMRKTGVKVTMGTVMDKSEILIAFM